MKQSIHFPTINNEATGARIRHYMEKYNYTPRELKEYLKLGSVQSIYHWLEGKTIPSIDNLFALSILFGVTIDDLISADCLSAARRREIIWRAKMERYYERLKEHLAS